MLVLRRAEGQWVEVEHRSGDVLRFRVYDVKSSNSVQLAFDDPARNFSIMRPEKKAKEAARGREPQ
jgi:hypothetical protein